MNEIDKELAKKIVQLFFDRWQVAEDYDKFEIVDEDDWTQDYKYQNCNPIVKYDGVLYQLAMSRSGSYHTDWYYNPTYVYEVSKETKEVVKIETTYKNVREVGYFDTE